MDLPLLMFVCMLCVVVGLCVVVAFVAGGKRIYRSRPPQLDEAVVRAGDHQGHRRVEGGLSSHDDWVDKPVDGSTCTFARCAHIAGYMEYGCVDVCLYGHVDVCAYGRVSGCPVGMHSCLSGYSRQTNHAREGACPARSACLALLPYSTPL